MKKRFLAILLCLSVLLMACACAAETMEPPAVSETESQAPTPQFTLSEVNAESSKTKVPATPSETAPAGSEPQGTISMEESDIELEPIVPKEKQTILEKVLSFNTGEDGLFEYSFVYAENPADPTIGTPIHYCVDATGDIYVATKSGIVCLNDGTMLKARFAEPNQMLACNGELFILDFNGQIRRYSVENGLEKATLIQTYQSDMFSGVASVQLLDIGAEEPVLMLDGNMYTLESQMVENPNIRFVKHNQEADSAILSKNGQTYDIYTNDGLKPYVYSCISTGIGLSVAQNIKKEGKTLREVLYSYYDQQGRLVSEFLYSRIRNCEVACEIPYDAGTVLSYKGFSVFVEEYVFEDVLQPFLLEGPNGTYYLLLYYADHGEVYKITPGYSGVKLSNPDVDLQENDDETEASVSAASASSNSITYVPATRYEASSEISRIIQTPWELLEGHVSREVPSNVTLPDYIMDTAVGTSMRGIPYCWGGFNSREEFIALADAEQHFPGNVQCVGGHKTGTIGLDCSGFVGRVTGVRMSDGTKPNTSRFLSFGHEVASIDDLQNGDVIVKGGSHVMLFVGRGNVTGYYSVYDVSTEPVEEKTQLRSVLEEQYDSDSGYKFLHIYYGTGYNSTQHWAGCTSCTAYRTYEDHTLVYTYSGHLQECTGCDYTVVLTPHTFTYTYGNIGHVATCSACGYSVTATHSMVLSSYVSTGHIYACTCGYSTSEAHTLSYHHNVDTHWRECSVCDYATAPLVHVFVNGRCRVCNALQIGSGPANIIVIPPEEDELLPVPEDQKAFL